MSRHATEGRSVIFLAMFDVIKPHIMNSQKCEYYLVVLVLKGVYLFRTPSFSPTCKCQDILKNRNAIPIWLQVIFPWVFIYIHPMFLSSIDVCCWFFELNRYHSYTSL